MLPYFETLDITCSRWSLAPATAAVTAATNSPSRLSLVHSQRAGEMSWLQASSRVRCSCSLDSTGTPMNTPIRIGMYRTSVNRESMVRIRLEAPPSLWPCGESSGHRMLWHWCHRSVTSMDR
jgi:hypothetical protein